MKTIDTLIEDIYGVFDQDIEVNPEVVRDFGVRLGEMLVARITERKKGTDLRLSNLGKPCSRQLWYDVNTPQLGEKLSGPARIKFLIGDITEHVVLLLAALAGHTVEFQQEEVDVDGVKGHIDAVIDGNLVDVKSASPYSFKKFEAGLTPENDAFGYLTQLGSYAKAKGFTHAYFLPVDKVLGTICLDKHEFGDIDLGPKIASTRATLAQPNPPERGFSDEPDGKSGNRKLGIACSYCAYKDTCWPGLKAYGYSNGVRFLTRVEKEPRVESQSS